MPSAIRVIDQASEIVTSTANFDGVLSGSDSDAQTALETIDEVFNGAIVFNEAGADLDYRFESVGQANALFVQGSDGFVGIGTATPGEQLEVAGSIKLGGTNNSIYNTAGYMIIDAPASVMFIRAAASGAGGVIYLADSTNANVILALGGGNVGIGLTPTVNMVGLSIEAGLLTLKERALPTADTNYGKIWTESDNTLHFQDGAGTEYTIDITGV